MSDLFKTIILSKKTFYRSTFFTKVFKKRWIFISAKSKKSSVQVLFREPTITVTSYFISKNHDDNNKERFESEGMNSYRHVPCHEEDRKVAIQRASAANALTLQ